MENRPKIGVFKQTDFIYKLLVLARKYKSNKANGGFQLASALIYANLAEYFSYELIFNIRSNIIRRYPDSEYQLNKEYTVSSEEKTLGKMIKLLKSYNFPNKQRTISLISNIKGNRDDLFHNLVETPNKKTGIFSLATNIQNQTEELLKVWANILDDFSTEVPNK